MFLKNDNMTLLNAKVNTRKPQCRLAGQFLHSYLTLNEALASLASSYSSYDAAASSAVREKPKRKRPALCAGLFILSCPNNFELLSF